MYKRWSLVIWVIHLVREFPLVVNPTLGQTSCLANFSLMHKVRMWFQVSERLVPSLNWKMKCQKFTKNL